MQEQQVQSHKLQGDQLIGALEAILFVAGDPIEPSLLCAALEIGANELETALKKLETELESRQGGVKLMRFGQRLQLCTRPIYGDYIERALNPARKQKLSGALLETLSVIAYKQPVTKNDIEQIRGVKCDYSIATLMRLGLICEVGRQDTLGRPILYGTTEAFLRHFGISDLDEMPAIHLDEQAEPFDEPL